jgi:LEA14-like dessication related protein
VLTRRSAFVALAGALLVCACSKPEPPTLVPKEAQVTGVGPAGLDVLLRMEATNPNRLTITAQAVTGKAKLDGKWDLGTVTIAKPVVLPPKTPTMIDIPMKLPWTDMKALAALASATGPVPYVVDGTVTIGGENLKLDLPFHVSGTVTREQIGAAAMKGMQGLPAIPGLTVPAQH